MTEHRGEDRRVQRTKQLLRGAMASLVHEKPYEAIAVKEILARAAVGRSAFYAHFRDKDALLVSAIRETLHPVESGTSTPPADPAEHVLRFSRRLFEHIEHAPFRGDDGTPATAPHAALHERVRLVLLEAIANDLSTLGISTGAQGRMVPPDLLAQHIADTFLRVLDWWVARGRPGGAAEADAMFRTLVLPAVTAAGVAGSIPTVPNRRTP